MLSSHSLNHQRGEQLDQLAAEKRKAVFEEDFDKAADLKQQYEKSQAGLEHWLRDQGWRLDSASDMLVVLAQIAVMIMLMPG